MMLSMAFIWDEEALLGVELEVDMCDAPKVPAPCGRKYPLYRW